MKSETCKGRGILLAAVLLGVMIVPAMAQNSPDVPSDAITREYVVCNDCTPDADAVAREITVFNAIMPAITDAIARDYVVCNNCLPDADAVTREMTVFNGIPARPIDAVAREFVICNNCIPDADAVTRELVVFNGIPSPTVDVTAREVTLFKYPPYTIADAILALKIGGGLTESVSTHFPRLDIEYNQRIDIKDAIRIFRKVTLLDP